jgi:hypothetical protein
MEESYTVKRKKRRKLVATVVVETMVTVDSG